jgi:acylglycerol lipase
VLLAGTSFASAVFGRSPSSGSSHDGQPLFPPEIRVPEDADPYLESISDMHGFLKSDDGTCVFYRYWTPVGQATPESVVILLHGMAIHGGRYKAVAEELTKGGIAVYAPDARGHGLSCGKRGHIPSTPVENQDLSVMVRFVRESYPRARIFLMAESMGGLFALNYAARNPDGISGLILVAPAVAVNRDQWWHQRTFKFLPDLLFARNKPVISMKNRTPEEQSAEDQGGPSNSVDFLSYQSVSINYILETHRAASHFAETASHVKVPTLVFQNPVDPVIDAPSVHRFFERLGADDKKLKDIESISHHLLKNSTMPVVLSATSDWISAHSQAEKAAANSSTSINQK